MTRFKWFVVTALCLLAFRTWPAYGCRYNVREVGFIDVGIEPYRLFAYLPEGTSPDEAARLKEEMDVVLSETNIRFEPVTAGADANHPAMKLAKTHGIERYPAAVLVSPDNQSMPLSLPDTAASVAKTLSGAVESVLVSPTRRQILEKCADNYGVVLLIEGPEQQRNVAAREAVSGAIARIGEQLEFLPKPISKGPEMVVLGRESLAREQVLLWSLGLKVEDINEPHAAIFYGRGRWIGPLFEGEILSSDHLAEVLSIIGADCECGLDHRWLQGTMLPARWDEPLHEKAAQSLGFDPEDPMVKMEMVSIIRRGMGGFDYPGVPLDYREIEIGGGAAEDTEQKTQDGGPRTEDGGQAAEGGIVKAEGPARSVPVRASDETPHGVTTNKLDAATPAVVPPVAATRGGESQSAKGGMEVGILAVSLGGMAALVAVASLVIVLRTRKS